MKTLVDVNTLFCLHASCTRKALLLWACQVNELQLTDCYIDWVPQVLWLYGKAEYTVRARTEVVEVVAGEDAVTSSILVQIEHFLRCSRFKNVQVLDNELVFLGPADSQASLPFNRVASFTNSLHNLRV